MKGVIILPKYLSKFWIPKVTSNGNDFSGVMSVTAPLYYMMCDTFGFELRYADEVDVDADTDIVFMFGVPYHNRPNLIPGIVDLDKKIKLVMFSGDVQCYNDKTCLDSRLKVYDRCDVILSQTYEYFAKLYPQFLSKFELFPLFFSPHDRYTKLLFNNKPKISCLLSGSVNEIYPLRLFIKNNIKVGTIRYESPIHVGDNYANLLHSYFCCVTSSSIFNYVLAKHFEIPATGALLLANETSDLERVGLVPYHHYIPITKENVFIKIKQCLENTDDYTGIRKEGMEFVRKNHSVINRIDQLKKVFNNLWR